VADNKFHCIILKGGDLYPYFPRPLLSEFDFSIPLTSTLPKPGGDKNGSGGNDDGDAEMRDVDDDDDDNDTNKASSEQAEVRRLEQQLVLGSLEAALVRDLVDATAAGVGRYELRARLARLELEHDKTLLQMLAGECRAGEERGMRALELVGLMHDKTGRMAEAAGKVAQRYGRTVLGDKIQELGERQLAGDDDGDEEGEDER
jgi:chromosome transmission fidelity protein 4